MVKMTFLGDIALNNRYSEFVLNNKNPFLAIKDNLFYSDLVVGNLECLLSGTSENLEKFPRLKTSRESLTLLKYLNLGLVTLAHNHVYDNLEEGFTNTTSFLKNNNINYIGASENIDSFRLPINLTINGIKFCFLNYVTEDTNPKIPESASIYVNYYDKDRIVKDIEKNKQDSDFVILLFHWGGVTEGYMQPTISQKLDSHSFIDAGADLIVGGHSHTLQPFEIYNGKYIFYSLGNFCFDDVVCEEQTFRWKEKSLESALVEVYFEKSKYRINLIPFKNVKNEIVCDYSVLKKLNYQNKIAKIVLIDKNIWNAYYFYQKKVVRFFEIFFDKELNIKDKFVFIYRKISKSY